MSVYEFKSTQFESLAQFKKSFRKLSLKIHPDKTGGSEEPFKEALEVYETGLTWFKINERPFCFNNRAHADNIFDFFFRHGYHWKPPKASEPKESPKPLFKGEPIVPTPAFASPTYAKMWARSYLCSAFCQYGSIPSAVSSYVNAVATLLNHMSSVYRRYISVGLKRSGLDFVGVFHEVMRYVTIYTPRMEKDGSFEERSYDMYLGYIPCHEEVPLVTLRFRYTKITQELVNRTFSEDSWAEESEAGSSSKHFKSSAEIQQMLDEIRKEVSSAKQAAMKPAFRKLQIQIETKSSIIRRMKEMHDKEVSGLQSEIDRLQEAATDFADEGTDAIRTVCAPVGTSSATSLNSIMRDKQLITEVYEFFDAVDIDSSGNFSLRDSLIEAHRLEFPDSEFDEREKFAVSGVQRYRRACKRSADGEVLLAKSRKAQSQIFLDYQHLTRTLLANPSLSRFCHMITSLAAREIAPSSAKVASLMLHLADISDNSLNINVAHAVLGLHTAAEKRRYVADLQKFNASRMTCMESLKKKKSICGRRVMIGKKLCSYHNRLLK